MYVCIDCGKTVEIELKSARKVQCPYCGYRILRKVRPPVPKRIPAR